MFWRLSQGGLGETPKLNLLLPQGQTELIYDKLFNQLFTRLAGSTLFGFHLV